MRTRPPTASVPASGLRLARRLDIRLYGAAGVPALVFGWDIDERGAVSFVDPHGVLPESTWQLVIPGENPQRKTESWNPLTRALLLARCPAFAGALASDLRTSWTDSLLDSTRQDASDDRVQMEAWRGDDAAWVIPDHPAAKAGLYTDRRFWRLERLSLQIQKRLGADLRAHGCQRALHEARRAGGPFLHTYNHLAGRDRILDAAEQNLAVGRCLNALKAVVDVREFFPCGRSLADSVTAMLNAGQSDVEVVATPAYLAMYDGRQRRWTEREEWGGHPLHDARVFTQEREWLDINHIRSVVGAPDEGVRRAFCALLGRHHGLAMRFLARPEPSYRALLRHPGLDSRWSIEEWTNNVQGQISDTIRAEELNVANMGFARLCRLTARHHERLAAMTTEEVLARALENFRAFPEPGLLGLSDAPWSVQWIPNSYDLAVEGHEMGHCVGSYADSCLNRESVIYSVREIDGGRVATLEVDADGRVVQLMGPGNTRVKDDLREWVAGVFERVDPLFILEESMAA